MNRRKEPSVDWSKMYRRYIEAYIETASGAGTMYQSADADCGKYAVALGIAHAKAGNEPNGLGEFVDAQAEAWERYK